MSLIVKKKPDFDLIGTVKACSNWNLPPAAVVSSSDEEEELH